MADIAVGVAYQCRRGVVRRVEAFEPGPKVFYRVLAHYQAEKVGRTGRIQLYGFARSMARRVWEPHPAFRFVQDYAAELAPGQRLEVRDLNLEGVQGVGLVRLAIFERDPGGDWQLRLETNDGTLETLRLLFSGALVSHTRHRVEEVPHAGRNEPRGRRRRH